MALENILNVLHESTEYGRLLDTLTSGGGPMSVFGLGEAHRIHAVSSLYHDMGGVVLFVAPTDAAANRHFEEISRYTADAVLFPSREMPLAVQHYTESPAISEKRLACMQRLMDGRDCIAVTSIEALMQRLAPPELILDATHAVRTGMIVSPDALLKKFIDAGYTREDVCEGKGQVAQRGGYIDIFPLTHNDPIRIEFFDDEIDTMRTFDALTQRSIENVTCAVIPPADELPLNAELRKLGIAALKNKAHYAEETEILRSGGTPDNHLMLLPLFCPDSISLIDYLPKGSVIVIDEPSRIEESAKIAFDNFLEGLANVIKLGGGHEKQSDLVHSPSDTIARLDTERTVMLFSFTRSYGLIHPKELIKFETRPVSRYMGNIELLKEDFLQWKSKGYSVLIYAGAHAARLHDALEDEGVSMALTVELNREIVKRECIIIGESIPKGFEYPEIKLAAISEFEIYGAEAPSRRTPAKKRSTLLFTELNVGDLIVHEAHGIGRFAGVTTLTIEGRVRDYLELLYLGGDKLFIPTDQLDRVQKYVGGDESKVKLSKLGSSEWQRTVAKTRESTRKLAFDLVALYGQRSRSKGYAFSKDTSWQAKLEASFPHVETADQLTSIAEIKQDMESTKIMDRLLCGDVGYGKTEVALRAAFKCAMDGKQCAVLVPTTILAQQHYNTFTSRFAGFPVNVELLSRFRTQKEQAIIKEKLKKGEIDVIIGTHSLLSKTVRFHDLGLLIIDEEQRFGVNHKEQIKELKRSVDVLVLSATPIPRTLHMSLSGIRDMSVIDTPPEARYPVQTVVCEYNPQLIRDAILRETARGGQVYFVYNIVKTMDLFAQRLQELIPEVRIAYAHGQMSERQLERTMLEFMEGKYDVLLCSTIIESGLDITNVNTMIVYDADKMGLAQLYQLRGRVGRGTRLGYAYLTFRQDKVISEIADKRLTAIKEFTQFGSGFKIAMRDLEIRGAGDVLGAEQSGHMAQVGYELYCKLIGNAIKEAKNEPIKPEVNAVMEIQLDAYIPKKYIPSEKGRIEMYKRIAAVCDLESLRDVQDELIDRYGDIPTPVNNLLEVSLYKSKAEDVGLASVSVKKEEAKLTFLPEAELDPERFIAAVNSIEGAQVTQKQSGEPGSKPVTILLIKRKNKSQEEMFQAAKQAINALLACVNTNGENE